MHTIIDPNPIEITPAMETSLHTFPSEVFLQQQQGQQQLVQYVNIPIKLKIPKAIKTK
jgi:hypothetical protein